LQTVLSESEFFPNRQNEPLTRYQFVKRALVQRRKQKKENSHRVCYFTAWARRIPIVGTENVKTASIGLLVQSTRTNPSQKGGLKKENMYVQYILESINTQYGSILAPEFPKAQK